MVTDDGLALRRDYQRCFRTKFSVTSCSHIFCDEDGTKEFNKSNICPACETNLSSKFDIIRIDLQPSEQYKSMVLAGQKPECVMEICTRALSFWTYQAHQERTYQEFIANKAKEKVVQLEQYYEQIISRTQTELSTLKTQLSGIRKDLDSTKKKYNEVSEKLMERSRQYQKLQSMYDSLRRKCITHTFDGDGDPGSRPGSAVLKMHNIPITTGEGFLLRKQVQNQHIEFGSSHSHSFNEKEFVLKPHVTPIISASDSNLSTVQNRFNLEIGTPSGLHQRR